jgi:hypothetical protein
MMCPRAATAASRYRHASRMPARPMLASTKGCTSFTSSPRTARASRPRQAPAALTMSQLVSRSGSGPACSVSSFSSTGTSCGATAAARRCTVGVSAGVGLLIVLVELACSSRSTSVSQMVDQNSRA